MQPGDVLAYTPSKGGLVIEAKHSRHLRVLGSSLPCSGIRDTSVSFVSLSMDDKKEGLVAVVVRGKKEENFDLFGLLLHVARTEHDPRPVLRLANSWAPTANRLAQISQHGPDNFRIEVTLENGVIAITKVWPENTSILADKLDEAYKRHAQKNHLHVPDGDLLCRYLIGDADLADLEAYAGGWEEEVRANSRLACAESTLERVKQDLRIAAMAGKAILSPELYEQVFGGVDLTRAQAKKESSK